MLGSKVNNKKTVSLTNEDYSDFFLIFVLQNRFYNINESIIYVFVFISF